MARFFFYVLIIPLIRSSAKAKFCNVLGHPISKAGLGRFIRFWYYWPIFANV